MVPDQSLVKSNLSDEIPPSQRVSSEDLFNQISTFLFAGSDTSSLALTWTLQLLTEHPDVQDRLRKELQVSCQSRSDIKTVLEITDFSTLDGSYADIFKVIDSLPYLDNVIRESLRLISPIHSSLRVSTRDDYIPFSEPVLLRDGTTQSGIWIKKGQFLHVPIESFNLNKNVWGEDAWSFKYVVIIYFKSCVLTPTLALIVGSTFLRKPSNSLVSIRVIWVFQQVPE